MRLTQNDRWTGSKMTIPTSESAAENMNAVYGVITRDGTWEIRFAESRAASTSQSINTDSLSYRMQDGRTQLSGGPWLTDRDSCVYCVGSY